ncbi:MAG: hypothetical protein FJ225_04780 [Lentisphaerae bacterium]|nr:hypothetical protein [Lentisphaerota bacterium]
MSDDVSADLPAGEEGSAAERDVVLDLNFIPAWARRSPQEFRYADHDGAEGHGAAGRRAGGRSRGRGEPGPARRDDRGRARDGGQPRGARRAAGRERRGPAAEAPRPPVAVRLLPDQKQISAVTRQLHGTKRSYPLAQIAALFVRNPDACHFRVEADPEHRAAQIFQCRSCLAVSMDRAQMLTHARQKHLMEYFDAEVIEGDAPKGDFTCVARCGLSGVLLGPPNHHGCEERIQEIHSARFSGMPLEQYRQKIEIVSDKALIEQWKEERRKRTVYRRKGTAASGGAPLTWTEADAVFQREVAPSLVGAVRRARLTREAALGTEDGALRRVMQEAWEAERRFPRSLLFALRAAFRHKKLHIFRVGRGAEFVAAIRPTPLEAGHVVQHIREVLDHLRAHPGCTREDLLATLRPGAEPSAEAVAQVLVPLGWLADRGHIIEFHDGTLSVPLSGSRAWPCAPRASTSARGRASAHG